MSKKRGTRGKIDLTKLKTYSITKRKSKVSLKDSAKPTPKGSRFRDFYANLPDVLAAKDFKSVVDAIVKAKKNNRPVIAMMGAHVIKCGLSPVIIELIKRDVITAVALNGAGIIHDFEIALSGSTSEDVADALSDGSFGMARETAQFLNNAVKSGVEMGLGVGYSVANAIAQRKLSHKNESILYNCYKKGIPATVHVAIGTDIIHQHPSCDGAAIGEGTLRDFYKFEEVVALLGGGVLINIGSAVILPEVFLKALSIGRNLGNKIEGFTTVNFDKERMYRPMQNVVVRPVLKSGKGYYIIGHHEIMIPLLAASILERS
ncbi:MAG: hypothetical protein AUJ75_01470 [Candidatus Omnitrophica bacterium CG1_02_49_10]|nr:MAG: hypothetical protein AUJ75_01470 [Candidatus Omnitrophica bacterium CG1_02_49_10]